MKRKHLSRSRPVTINFIQRVCYHAAQYASCVSDNTTKDRHQLKVDSSSDNSIISPTPQRPLIILRRSPPGPAISAGRPCMSLQCRHQISRLGPRDVIYRTTTSAIRIMRIKLLLSPVSRHAADTPITDMQSVVFTNTIQEQ
jgi:hypothetical protein